MVVKVFFSCSMSGGHPNIGIEALRQIPPMLRGMGFYLVSDHQTREGIMQEEREMPDTAVYQRDYQWLEESDWVLAELSNPSLGVGGEVSDAIHMRKPLLGVYHESVPIEGISFYTTGKIRGYHTHGRVEAYKNIVNLAEIINEFSRSIGIVIW